jgi:NADH-quinone oxidoreductase subunit G
MIRRCGLNFAKLQPSAPDSVYGPTSGAGVIFGVTGGVTEAVLRKVVNDTSDTALEQISYVGVRGLEGVKEATVSLGDKELKIAVVSGLANTSRLLEALKDGSKHYDLVEVMACPGGCVYGGGQPKTESACEHQARFNGLYNADKASAIRTSQQNKAVEDLLESLGDKKHDLLHVHYVKH